MSTRFKLSTRNTQDLGKITERTLYAPIIEFLKELGFEGAVQETEVSGLYPDVTFWRGDDRFILQVKIGEETKLVEGMSDSYEHGRRSGISNLIVLVYPSEVRRPLITDINKIALDTKIICLLLTKYWAKKVQLTARQVFAELKTRIDAREVAPPSIDVVVDALSSAVSAFAETLRSLSQLDLKHAIDFVVGRFDMFMALAESKEGEETLRTASLDMLSYLLVNQILFYHVYSKMARRSNLPLSRQVDELPGEIGGLSELVDYFTQITDINYRTIYAIDVASRLPSKHEIVDRINQIIKTIHSLKPENVEHDLLGRLFHELLPQKTRKILAAFYTKPQAAEILASLAIDSQNEKIVEPACGSGTLAVAAYHKKMLLAGGKQLTVDKRNDLHKQFVEREISCFDIMPFAAHLTAVNLSSQTITATTDYLRVAVGDSLELSNKNMREGYNVPAFSATVQQTLFEQLGPAKRESRGAVSANGRGKSFILAESDCVIMNPPFTDRKRLPKDYRSKLMDKEKLPNLIKICGSNMNLWGYFVALANQLLTENGTVAAVIPMNVLRGESTQKLRDFLLTSYTIKYVVTSTVDVAFSESAVYRDLLFVADKTIPERSHSVCFVFLKNSLNNMTVEKARSIVGEIRKVAIGNSVQADDFTIKWVSQSNLQRDRINLMSYLRGTDSTQKSDLIKRFLGDVKRRAGDVVTRIATQDMIRGFEQSPKGLPQICFVARPVAEDRLKRAFMILEKEDGLIKIRIKDTDLHYEISKRNVVPALRSLTNIKRFNVTGIHDYLIKGNYEGFKKVLPLTQWKGRFEWNIVEDKLRGRTGQLFIATRFRPTSDNTHLIAFTCEQPFATTNKFTLIKVHSKEEAQIQCLMLNSVVALASMVQFMSSVTGGFIELKHYDLKLFLRFDFSKLDKKIVLRLSKIAEELGRIEFSPLLEQLKSRFAGRVKLDYEILRAIGFEGNEIDHILPKMYDRIVEELLKLREHQSIDDEE